MPGTAVRLTGAGRHREITMESRVKPPQAQVDARLGGRPTPLSPFLAGKAHG